MADIIFVDVETTGLDPATDSIIQLGVLRTDSTGRQLGRTLNFKVTPTTRVHPAAAKVNGYTEEGWVGAESPAYAAAKLAEIGAGAEFAAHCVWFDHGFAEKLLRDHGYRLPWGRRLIDTQTLAHLMRAESPSMRGTNLQSCIEKLGGERGEIHDAYSDASWAREVYVWAYNKVSAPDSENNVKAG